MKKVDVWDISNKKHHAKLIDNFPYIEMKSFSCLEEVKFTFSHVKFLLDSIYFYNEKNKLHREIRPAVLYANGRKEWWDQGERHNETGPAIITADDGSKFYYVRDKLHRMNGPAIEWSSGLSEWYYQGSKLSLM